MKTSGIYIVEKSAFPNSVVEVAATVPAFIGHAEYASNDRKLLLNMPWRISSIAECHSYFGEGPYPTFMIKKNAPATKPAVTPDTDFSLKDKQYSLEQNGGKYLLYYSMPLFFANGRGSCSITSVGDYKTDIVPNKLTNGVNQLVREQEPIMVVTPEAILLKQADCISSKQASLQHCGKKMRYRGSILDIYDGHKDRHDSSGDMIDLLGDSMGINYLDLASSYYPWLNTTITRDKDMNYLNIMNKDTLQTLLKNELATPSEVKDNPPPKAAQMAKAVDSVVKADLLLDEQSSLNKTLILVSPLFNSILKDIKSKFNLLPPSAAMAGVRIMVDNTIGVCKAPANVSLNQDVSPAVNIAHDDQADLNILLHGKSINAIRAFIGEGTLVWGARNHDGNSQNGTYVNMRKTMIMPEEPIRIATKAYMFEPYVANTWITVKSMISNFLTGIWKRCRLAGASPDDVFSLHVEQGETMTPNDILDDIMKVTVLATISKFAEFIEITFQQQMQKS